MENETNSIDKEALDGLAVAPPDPDAEKDAAEKNAAQQAELDRALRDSMDASDPPSQTQPKHPC